MIHIAFCTDFNYVMPTGIAMISICENNKDTQITFHIVVASETPEIKDASIQPLEEIAKKYHQDIVLYNITDTKLSSFVCSGANYISTTAFARIFLPEILPLSIKKVLYLDGDIVVNGSILDLWNAALPNNCPLGAVIDAKGNSVNYRRLIKTPLSIPYVNSGVLLMNVEFWRENNITQKLVDCAIEKKFPLLDQDTINYCLRDSIEYLPIKYNFQNIFLMDDETQWLVDAKFYDEIIEAKNHPIIVHYLSANKPWMDCWCPLRETWEKYESLSPWAGQKRTFCLTRPDRTLEFKELENIYWQDSELMLQTLPTFIRLFKIAVRVRNHKLIMNFGLISARLVTWAVSKIKRFNE